MTASIIHNTSRAIAFASLATAAVGVTYYVVWHWVLGHGQEEDEGPPYGAV